MLLTTLVNREVDIIEVVEVNQDFYSDVTLKLDVIVQYITRLEEWLEILVVGSIAVLILFLFYKLIKNFI